MNLANARSTSRYASMIQAATNLDIATVTIVNLVVVTVLVVAVEVDPVLVATRTDQAVAVARIKAKVST